jgi:hypothetical protein
MADELIIPRGREKPIRGIYSPRVHAIAQGLGKVTTRRASHVEPTEELSQAAKDWIWNHIEDADVAADGLPSGVMEELHEAIYPPGKWWADCLPVGGPVLGPFDDRDTALQKESEWLRANNIPTAEVPHGIQIEPPTEPVLTQDDLDRMG